MTSRVYVNLYGVTRRYGGPQEGGWWFDVGAPIECHPIRGSMVRALNVADWIQDRLDAIRKGQGRRAPVIVALAEEHPARPWPVQRPRYS